MSVESDGRPSLVVGCPEEDGRDGRGESSGETESSLAVVRFKGCGGRWKGEEGTRSSASEDASRGRRGSRRGKLAREAGFGREKEGRVGG